MSERKKACRDGARSSGETEAQAGLKYDTDGAAQFHALAELFPPLGGDEFNALVADIRAHGLRQRIVLHEGAILGGRNRYRACIEAGIEPQFEVFNGDDPLDLCRFVEPCQAAFIPQSMRDGGRETREHAAGRTH
jgi:hypothetical protein